MRPLAVLALLPLLALPAPAGAANPLVRFTTSLGIFDVEVCEAVSTVCEHAAPGTAANFLGYVDRGDYADSIVHRSVPTFVIQGGGFQVGAGPAVTAIGDGTTTVDNEFSGFPNRRGTLSVPLLGDGPTPCDTVEDSGSSGWFVNLKDNSATLDCGLFTVFAVVVGDGMQVVDAIGALPRLEFYDPNTGTAPQFLLPLFQPQSLITAFTTVPFPQAFWERATNPGLPPPTLQEVADAFVVTDVTRVPEPGAALAGAGAGLALAAVARRRRRRAEGRTLRA
jgi:cyclophilin family peptidyl-prolyl cis-trans isomerase